MNFTFLAAAIVLALQPQGDAVNVEFAAIILDDGVSTSQWRGNADSGENPVDYANLYYISDDQVHSINVPFSALSEYRHYSGLETLNFYLSPPNIEEPVDTWPAPVASVKMQDALGRTYLIFITEDFYDMRFRVLPIAAAPDNESTLRIFNFSRLPITTQIGDRQNSVSVGSSLELPFDTDERYQRFRVAAYQETIEQWQVIYSRWLQIRDGLSVTVLIFPDLRRRDGAMIRLIREEGTMRRTRLHSINTSQ